MSSVLAGCVDERFSNSLLYLRFVLNAAMASEGVTVALSPQPGFQKGLLEITFGALGNTKTTILRKLRHSHQTVSIPCRVCQEGTWNSFWIGIWKGKAYAGVGNLPGKKSLLFMDLEDSSGDHNVKNVENVTDTTKPDDPEAGNETKDSANATTTTQTDNFVFVGFGNSAQQRRPIKIRNLHVTPVPSFVAHQLEITTDASTMDVLMDQQDEIDDDALKEYQEQCRKAKARAQKFGTEYKEPSLADVVPWSQARKLRANPQKGFITGIDVTDPEELAKQEARKSRFGISSKKRELEDHNNDDDDGEKTDLVDAENTTAEGDAAAGGAFVGEESIPARQAWDNEELTRFQRCDPPPSLWKVPPEGEAESETADEFAMETDKATLVPEKIHMFSIDWSAFKQIRSEDIMVSQVLLLY